LSLGGGGVTEEARVLPEKSEVVSVKRILGGPALLVEEKVSF